MFKPSIVATSLITAAIACHAVTAADTAPPNVAALAADALGLESVSIQEITLDREDDLGVTASLRLDGRAVEMGLQLHSLRAPGFEVLVPSGEAEVRPIDVGPSRTYRGQIVGQPESRVSASFFNGRLHATILTDDGSLHYVRPLDDVLPDSEASGHVVYRHDAIKPIDMSCPVEDHVGVLEPDVEAESAGGPPLFAKAQIAFDADFDFYFRLGQSVEDTVAFIENTVNDVDFIFQRDAGIMYEITAIIVRTFEPDPYYSTDSSDLLEGFQDHWNTFHGGIIRDVAHLMTGKDLDGNVIGKATIGAVCEIGEAYGLSALYQGGFPQAVLTAHELGHNWDARHCDGEPDCGIMCSSINCGLNGVVHFGSSATGSILSHRGSRWCLDFVGVPPVPCPEDITGDRVVSLADLLEVLASWGPCGGCDSDIDGDGAVGMSDLLALLLAWGSCPAGPDLIVTDIVLPAYVAPGDNMPVEITITNAGDTPVDVDGADGLLLGTWLTLDGNPFNGNGDDIPMGGPTTPYGLLRNVHLEPGASMVVNFTSLPVPMNALMGQQQFVACIDLGAPPCGGVCETNELNNCRTEGIVVAGPDLVVTDVIAPATISLGCSQTVTLEFTNQGLIPAVGNVNLGLWLSIDGNPFNGNGDDIPMGGPAACVQLNLDPGETDQVTFLTLPVPWNAYVGTQQWVACIDTGVPPCGFVPEMEELNNCYNESVQVDGPDAEVISVSAPSTALTGENVPVDVCVRNNSACFLDIPFRVTLGANFSDCWVNNVAPGDTVCFTCNITAPPSAPRCNDASSFTVTACTNLAVDYNAGNNCRSTSIGLIQPVPDIELKLLSTPSSAWIAPCHFQPVRVDWKIRVTNVGRADWTGGCLYTGIVRDSGPGDWYPVITGNPWTRSIPYLQPGHSVDIRVDDYPILCGAYSGEQWIKAEVNYDNCADQCGIGWGNNFDQDDIDLYR